MAPTDLVPEERLRRSYIVHALTAQLYRLLAASEADHAAEFAVEGAGPGLDPSAIASLARLLGGSRITGCEIALADDGTWIFAARLGEGEGPNSALAPAGLIRGVASACPADLPQILELRAELGSEPRTRTGAAAVLNARVRGLVHYFFSLVENPSRDPVPFHELLAPSFALDLVDPPLQSLEAVDGWVTVRLASVVASEHAIAEIAVEADEGLLRVIMKSQALFPDGSGAISRNTQRWRVRDDGQGRFPRIESIAIERDGVIFFGPAPDYAPRAAPRLP
ncbi:hypothetical protein [Novosphingobium sp. Gsoil 351]|uniref:hypothetical protein n=1 Tax=Novosphingobium sp. Gsoil 351 TaxID=2675225 RepID=UPI0012B48764|nr:hypothetical protein [Novosphingobium sp. Gsoil 351]QGN53466.1 hypothetical protein GKE62_01800 [Novosphingobium sp. Gsoil 351]